MYEVEKEKRRANRMMGFRQRKKERVREWVRTIQS